MLLYHGNGTYNYSPYLDSHGEIDIGLRKGRPQRLHQQRYDELRKQVLNHGVANIVARKIEAVSRDSIFCLSLLLSTLTQICTGDGCGRMADLLSQERKERIALK